MPQAPPYDRQNLQSNLGVLTADLLEVALVDEERDHRFHHPHRGRVWPSIEQGQFGYCCRCRLNGKHDLASTGRCPKDLHAALNDEEYPGAFLSFPEKHFIRRKTLLDFAGLPPTPLEKLESIDMLRLLEHGYRVKMVRTKFNTQAVDTPADLERVAGLMESDPLLASY